MTTMVIIIPITAAAAGKLKNSIEATPHRRTEETAALLAAGTSSSNRSLQIHIQRQNQVILTVPPAQQLEVKVVVSVLGDGTSWKKATTAAAAAGGVQERRRWILLPLAVQWERVDHLQLEGEEAEELQLQGTGRRPCRCACSSRSSHSWVHGSELCSNSIN
ncbi:hypothetical protein VPH35_002944 [Triticum aestivum]